MNAIFAAVFLVSTVLFLFTDPNGFLAAMLSGGEKAAALSLSLLAVYCVWLGFFKVLEKSGLSTKLANCTYPLCKRIFRSDDREAVYLASCNLSANFLGLPGAPTPLGVKAVRKFTEKGNHYGADMLFVLNATSLQLLPTTVIALRLAAGSASAADIFLPTLLSTLFSTLLGGALVWLTSSRKIRARRDKPSLRPACTYSLSKGGTSAKREVGRSPKQSPSTKSVRLDCFANARNDEKGSAFRPVIAPRPLRRCALHRNPKRRK